MFLDKDVCYCSTMNRIDLPHLVWTLEELVAGRVPNRIEVEPTTALRGARGAGPDAGAARRRRAADDGGRPAAGVTSPKGRPTPKRAAAARGPVPPPPQTRKEAVKRLREQQAAGRKDLKAGYRATTTPC